MKLLSTFLTAIMLFGLAGAASAACNWGEAEADGTAQSTPLYPPQDAGA